MGGMGTVGGKVTSFMDKVPGHKLTNKVLGKVGLPTDHDLLDTPEVETEETTVIPTMDSEGVQAAKRRRTAEQMARGGRQSTILTDRLGG